MTWTVRPPAVAGMFYEGDPARLRAGIERMLDAAGPIDPGVDLRMVIVPHAGYVYSGPVAATGYRLVRDLPSPPRRVALVGPSHFAWFPGLALPDDDAVATPLGEVPLDPMGDELVEAGLAIRSAAAHSREHSLEVQVPFLQVAAEPTGLVLALTGDEDPGPAEAAIRHLLESGLFVVVSSDLSHYLPYDEARRVDAVSARSISSLRPEALGRESACGRTAVRGALAVASALGWGCTMLDLRNSGDTAGPRDRVVGYGAFALGPKR